MKPPTPGYREARELALEAMARPYQDLTDVREELRALVEERRRSLAEAAHHRALKAHASSLEAQMGAASSIAAQVKMGGLDPSAYGPLEQLRMLHREVRGSALAEVESELGKRSGPDPRVNAVVAPADVSVEDRRSWMQRCDDAIALATQSKLDLEEQLADIARRAPSKPPAHLTMAWSSVEEAVGASSTLRVGGGLGARLRTDWELAPKQTRVGCVLLLVSGVAVIAGLILYGVLMAPVQLHP